MKIIDKLIYILITIIFLGIISCRESKNSNAEEQKVTNVTVPSSKKHENKTTSNLDSLIFYYGKVSNSNTTDSQFNKYNEFFPSSFKEFTDYFGFDDEKGKMPLYDNANDYIDLFFSDKNINTEYIYNKVIKISQNGEWEADAVNFLIHKISMILDAKNTTFIDILSSKDLKTQEAFWFFYFDGPHPPDSIPENILNIISKNENMRKAVESGLQKAKASGIH